MLRRVPIPSLATLAISRKTSTLALTRREFERLLKIFPSAWYLEAAAIAPAFQVDLIVLGVGLDHLFDRFIGLIPLVKLVPEQDRAPLIGLDPLGSIMLDRRLIILLGVRGDLPFPRSTAPSETGGRHPRFRAVPFPGGSAIPLAHSA